jgi:serine/threonine protein kinase/Tfp pilus assembly protein PilF
MTGNDRKNGTDKSAAHDRHGSESATILSDPAGQETGSSTRLSVGSILNDRYEILRLLGKGGMGEVYLAVDTRINRNVAVKVLHPDLASSKESLTRFAREAQTVSALNHPHILTIFEFDNAQDGELFFVTEYVDGVSLNQLIGRELSLEKALDIAIQVSTAISAAHEAGIIHRDIKPENILVRTDGYVKVLDFGLAKLTQKASEQTTSGSEDPTRALDQTKPGAVMGTAAYMSPEQARGKPVDGRTDVWSIGVLLYEMVTGQRPFSGETQADLMVSVLTREPPPMSFYLNVPPELEWTVSKALAKNADDRYQTVKGLRSDLERIKKQLEFEDKLGRSQDFPSSNVGPYEASSTFRQVADTAGEPAEPTSGGRDGMTQPRPLLSSPTGARIVNEVQSHKTRYSVVAAVLVVLLLIAAYVALVAPVGDEPIDSIAILPFENPGGDPELAYISEGLSEGLIDQLSQLPDLKVIARNSSFKFRGPDIDVRDVASQLNVRAIATGSVVRNGDDLIIRVDVVDATDDRQLMGGQYRRKIGELAGVQNEIARSAVERLRPTFTDSLAQRIAGHGTENSDAYRYYLNGLVELNGPQDVRGNALEYFERAAALDPDFASAHAEMAWIYWSQANESGDPGKLIPKARAATERALAVDPEHPKAHVIRAMLNEHEFDWTGAEREYKRAIELSPNLNFARNNYAFFLSTMGRHPEALAELEQQNIRDPINRRLGLLQKGIILTQARRFDEALRVYQEAQAVEPTREIPNFSLGYAYAGKGLYKDAAGYYKKSVDLVGGPEKYSQALVYLAATYARIPEKREEARAILAKIEGMGQYASPALLAAVYAALDDNDKAMELLERAYIKRDVLLRFVATGYEYDSLRNDPRFDDLIKRIGLKQ